MKNGTSFGIHLTTRFATLVSKGEANLTNAVIHGILLQMAEIADQDSTISSVWVGDSILIAPRLASIPFMSAVAARTKRVVIGSSCMSSFALRHPIMLALEWATLDQLSSGRTILVPCLGHHPKGPLGEKQKAEWEVFQKDIKNRIQLFEEGIQILRGLWANESFSYEGKHYKLRDVSMMVKPVQNPPPIWIANHPIHIKEDKVAETSARRIARLADGWQVADSNPEEFVRWRDWVTRLGREEYGRNMNDFKTCFVARLNINLDREAAFKEGSVFGSEYMRYQYSKERAERYLLAYGTPDDCIKGLEKIVEVQPTYIDIQLTGANQMEQLKILLHEVLPSF